MRLKYYPDLIKTLPAFLVLSVVLIIVSTPTVIANDLITSSDSDFRSINQVPTKSSRVDLIGSNANIISSDLEDLQYRRGRYGHHRNYRHGHYRGYHRYGHYRHRPYRYHYYRQGYYNPYYYGYYNPYY